MDNKAAEYTFFKDTRHSPDLHKLCAQFIRLRIKGDIHLHVVWVAGMGIIVQGTNRLSGGNFINKSMGGEVFLSFIPISKTSFEKSLLFKSWLLDTLLLLGFLELSYED